MTADNHLIAQRLQSWMSFYSNAMWMHEQAQRPLADALDAILASPPAWVTPDPLPETDEDELRSGGWLIETLLIAAWASGDAELTALADHCEELGAYYLEHLDKAQH